MTSLPNDTMRTLVVTGRPVRLFVTPYVKKWETERKEESKFLVTISITAGF
jgi:hypothetical protein